MMKIISRLPPAACGRALRALRTASSVSLAAALAMVMSTVGVSAQPNGRDLVLHDDFEGSDFTPEGGLFYKKNHEQDAGSVQFQSRTVRSGTGALDLSVRPQCPEGKPLCSERAEIWERPETLVIYGDPVWYSFSMRMATPIPTERHRYVMAQWKREIIPGADGDYSPLLALRMIDGRLAVTIDTDAGRFVSSGTSERPAGCLPGEAAAGAPDDYEQFRSLVAITPGGATAPASGFEGCTPDLRVTARGGNLPRLDSGWIDFVFQVKPGPAGDGRVDVIANKQWIATVEGTIGHEGPGLGDHLYFKFGPYRAGRDNVWRIYYDTFRRGPHCTDVASAEVCAPVVEASGAVASEK